MKPSPPIHLSVNPPILTNHHRIISRSEQITEHRVRSPLALYPYVIYLYCYDYCLFIVSSPPLSADRRCDRCRCFPFDRLHHRRPCTPTVEQPGKQCPITSPTYRLSVYIYLLH